MNCELCHFSFYYLISIPISTRYPLPVAHSPFKIQALVLWTFFKSFFIRLNFVSFSPCFWMNKRLPPHIVQHPICNIQHPICNNMFFIWWKMCLFFIGSVNYIYSVDRRENEIGKCLIQTIFGHCSFLLKLKYARKCHVTSFTHESQKRFT